MTLHYMISQRTVLIAQWVLPVGFVAEKLNIMLFMHVRMVCGSI